MPSNGPSDPSQVKVEPIRSFGRRLGKKLRPGQQRLMDDLLPTLRFDPNGEFEEQFSAPGQPAQEVWLEIGFGGGEHLGQQAKDHPDISFIGCEPFINGVVKLTSIIKKEHLQNIRIWDDDARAIFDAIPDGRIGRVFILFPDPWPKKRHAKRRLIEPETLDQLARIMKPGAELRIASDHMEYIRWALFQVSNHPGFSWLAEGPADWREPPADWVETRYQQKAAARGIGAVFLLFSRLSKA